MSAAELAEPSMLDHALGYGADGARIFPVNPRNKVPLIKKYHDVATSDAEQIRAWWTRWPDALIAVRVADDMLVIDVDPKHRGDTTWEALGGDDIASGLRHASGRNDGGRHHWYWRPDDLHPSTTRLNAWARERGLGEATEGDGWTAGIDVLTSTHRYSIVPPSLHPDSGQPYWWDAEGAPDDLPDILAELLSPPEPKPAPPRAPRPARPSEGETPADWFTRTAQWSDILKGWELVDGNGETDESLWKHPTATAESSASIRHGCLFSYSTNLPFVPTGHNDPHGYTKFHAYAVLEHGGDLSEAARHIRTTMMPPATQTPPANVDGDTGEIFGPAVDTRLGDEFWSALPVLEHIRTAARARRAAPTAVLGSVLARVAAFTPPSTCVPPFVGGTVPLSIIVALVGSTSTGKSINERVAAELLPDMPPGVAGPFSLGSGEGAAEAYVERYTAKDDDGRSVQRQRQIHYGVLFTLDEGRVLTDLGSRSGSTIVPTLCTMWTGGDPGRMNASADTRRTLPVGGYTFGLVTLWQPTRMSGLFDDTDGGLPGRFLFLGVEDPDVPDVAPDWPGPFPWTPPHWIAVEGVTRPTPMRYPPEAANEVDAHRIAKLRGEPVAALDGHRDLGRLKIAGALAVLDGQHSEVGDIHWRLAGELLDSSDRIRRAVLAELDHERRRAEDSGNARAGRREVAKVIAVETKALDAATRAIGRKAHREAPKVVQRQHLSQAIKGTDRKVVGIDAAIEEAERLGYIVPVEGGWIAGESRPA
jgi:hypothetical protein